MRRRLPAFSRGLLLLLVLTGRSWATHEPQFILDSCAWRASDIVVGRQNGQSVTIEEIWKGHSAKGTVLGPFDLPVMPMKVSLPSGTRPAGPKTVSGRRVVLFLIHAKSQEPGHDQEWKGAGETFSVSVGAAWIEEGQVYALLQPRDPGPQGMWPLGLDGRPQTSEEELKQAVNKVLGAKDERDKAEAIADPAERAAALRPLADGPSCHQRDWALWALACCGQPAVPILKDLLAKHPADGRLVVRYLYRAAGEDAGRVMTEVVQDELAFWKTGGPKLPAGWGNDARVAETTRREWWRRQEVLQDALEVIERMDYGDARPILVELRDLWKTLPSPARGGSPGDPEIVGDCNDVLAMIDRQDDDRPKFSFTYRFPRSNDRIDLRLVDEANAIETKASQIEFLTGLLPPIDDPKKPLTDRQYHAIALLGQTRSSSAVPALIDRLEFSAPTRTNPAIAALRLVGEAAVEPLVQSLQTGSDQRNNFASQTLKEIKGKKFGRFVHDLIARPDLKLSQTNAQRLIRYSQINWTD